MSVFKRSVRSIFILMAVGLTTSCSVTEAATGSSDQAHIDHDAFLKAHDAKLGDKSTPGSLIGLTSKLSDDIGKMSLQIADMSERILKMAGNIVKVIELETQAATDMSNLGADLSRKISAINAACNTSASGVTLSPPSNLVSITSPPTITYTNAVPTTKYQLLVSKSALFPNGSTVNKLVDTAVGASSLNTAWTQAMSDLAITANQNTQLYIAVRSVDAKNNPSDLSNGVLLTVN